MEDKYSHYLLYPIREGNIATIITPSVLFSLMVFISRLGAKLLGPYGAVPALLVGIAVIGFSMDYLRQITKSAASGETEAPEWKIEKVDIEELFRGVIPVAVTFFEVLFFAIPVNFFISINKNTGFFSQFIVFWKLLIFIPFVVLYPINLLSYSIFDDFVIIRFFGILSKNSILKIFTLYAFSFAALVFVVFLPLWKNFFLVLTGFAIIFYLFQIWAYGLGGLYSNSSDSNNGGLIK
jgi:hypothetical protein